MGRTRAINVGTKTHPVYKFVIDGKQTDIRQAGVQSVEVDDEPQGGFGGSDMVDMDQPGALEQWKKDHRPQGVIDQARLDAAPSNDEEQALREEQGRKQWGKELGIPDLTKDEVEWISDVDEDIPAAWTRQLILTQREKGKAAAEALAAKMISPEMEEKMLAQLDREEQEYRWDEDNTTLLTQGELR